MRRFGPVRSARRASWSAERRDAPPATPRVGRSRVPLHRRLLAARSAIPYWVAVAALALSTGAMVARLVQRSAAAERRLGATRQVVVTTRPLAAGRAVSSSAIRLETRPRSFVPRGALTRLPDGITVVGPVEQGEILTAARLDHRRTTLAEGRSALAVPVGDGAPAVRPGERVDVFATFDPSLAPRDDGPTSLVATHATVVAANHAAVTVAVRADEAPRLATALAQGTVTLALVG